MNKMTRLTISLPEPLVQGVDRKLARPGESRSAVVRRLLEEALREAEEREEVERYVRGYREEPQTEEEFGWSDRASAERLGELPWQ